MELRRELQVALACVQLDTGLTVYLLGVIQSQFVHECVIEHIAKTIGQPHYTVSTGPVLSLMLLLRFKRGIFTK